MAFTIERQEIILRICKNCKGLDGYHFLTTKKRCLICEKLTQPIEDDFILRKDRAGKLNKKNYPKGVKRFPRELTINKENLEVVQIIEEKCKDFDCPGKITDVKVGPIVTEYKFVPDRYTRVKRLKSLNEDLAIALKAENVSVQRMAGEAAINISIPNKDRKTIFFKDTLQNIFSHRYDMALPMNIGITSAGDSAVIDLADMPHLLVAGTTGSGKSVFLNDLLMSLLYIRSPKDLKLVLVDPKTVELFPYKEFPHLMMEPIADIWRVLGTLDTLIEEMKRRTSFLHFRGCKNLKELNEKLRAEGKAEECLPYIVIVFDEIADLILQEKKEFSGRLAQLAAMSRAAGIHIIACTQRPSVDILKGSIKVNFPARISFQVPSAQDSKTVLSVKGAGAEQLLGKGDMLAVLPNKAGIQHFHSALATKGDLDELKKLSLEIGNFNAVPADGFPTEEFLKTKKLTLAKVAEMTEEQKANLRTEYREWRKAKNVIQMKGATA